MSEKSKAEIYQEAAIKHPMITNPVETGMNVVTKEEYTELAKFVFNQIVNVLSKSYGPYGSMSLINRASMRFSTKDGWRILMHTTFDHNVYYQAIHRMIFEICEQMNDTVGDGTTTVILMANRIYEELIKTLPKIDDMDLPPREVSRAFDRIVKNVTEELKKRSRPFSKEYIRPIALISTNNDTQITDCICELYDRKPNADIQIMESNKIGVSVEGIDGLKIPVMLLDRMYINNTIDKCCDVDDAVFMVFNHKIGENHIRKMVLPMESVARMKGKRLVVIAPAYEESMLLGLWRKKAADEFRETKTTTTILCHYRSTVLGSAGADDLAILLDTDPIDGRLVDEICKGNLKAGTVNEGTRFMLKNMENSVSLMLGHCEKAKLGWEIPSFFTGLHPVPNMLDAQMNAVKAEIQSLEDTMTVTEKATSMKLSTLRKRLSRLEMKMSVIYYGSDSTFEKEMLHDTIQDGVRALESARDNGIIRGSQYDLLDACKEVLSNTDSKLDQMLIQNIITGIQAMLMKDLYGKSKAFSLADEIMHRTDDEPTDTFTGDYGDRFDRACEFLKEKNNPFEKSIQFPGAPLDLVTMEPDPNLITSTETDVCALKATIELLKVLIAGNQLLMVDQ